MYRSSRQGGDPQQDSSAKRPSRRTRGWRPRLADPGQSRNDAARQPRTRTHTTTDGRRTTEDRRPTTGVRPTTTDDRRPAKNRRRAKATEDDHRRPTTNNRRPTDDDDDGRTMFLCSNTSGRRDVADSDDVWMVHSAPCRPIRLARLSPSSGSSRVVPLETHRALAGFGTLEPTPGRRGRTSSANGRSPRPRESRARRTRRTCTLSSLPRRLSKDDGWGRLCWLDQGCYAAQKHRDIPRPEVRALGAGGDGHLHRGCARQTWCRFKLAARRR